VIGNGYWSNGITIRYRSGGSWGGQLEYTDAGNYAPIDRVTRKVSTEGKLHTRYVLRDGAHLDALTVVVDTLLADAARLGIAMREPHIHLDEEEHSDEPEGWEALAVAQCQRLGWELLPYPAAAVRR
jgi:hypothetical protein